MLFTKETVPQWLHSSGFYSILEDGVEFNVEPEKIKLTDEVETFEDFVHYFNTISYWGEDKLSQSFCEFCLDNKKKCLKYFKSQEHDILANKLFKDLNRVLNISLKYKIFYINENEDFGLTIYNCIDDAVISTFRVIFDNEKESFDDVIDDLNKLIEAITNKSVFMTEDNDFGLFYVNDTITFTSDACCNNEEYQDFISFQIEVSDFNVERIKLDLHELISKLNEVKEKIETYDNEENLEYLILSEDGYNIGINIIEKSYSDSMKIPFQTLHYDIDKQKTY